jgi:hypothetical protein
MATGNVRPLPTTAVLFAYREARLCFGLISKLLQVGKASEIPPGQRKSAKVDGKVGSIAF